MQIALIGTRGVPARYGGFETAVEEVGSRLASRGHDVVVYCRGEGPDEHKGMRLVRLPSVASKVAETLSHTALSVGHVLAKEHADAVVVFNAANVPLIPPLLAAGHAVAVHVDGLESRRGKWGPVGRRYYQTAERLAVAWADELIADAVGIADHYRATYGAETRFIPYGAPLQDLDRDLAPHLEPLGVERDGFHLVVARMEPENNVELMVRGYVASDARCPLLVVGSSPYADEYQAAVHAAAADDPRVHFLGSVWDQDQLDALYAGALTYLHGHCVGGTNPSLLRAMGAGAATTAVDVVFTREVLGETGLYFSDEDGVAEALEKAEADPASAWARGLSSQDRAAALYRWDDVTDGYEALCEALAAKSRNRARRRSAEVRDGRAMWRSRAAARSVSGVPAARHPSSVSAAPSSPRPADAPR